LIYRKSKPPGTLSRKSEQAAQSIEILASFL
jgi:hypothetical protein